MQSDFYLCSVEQNIFGYIFISTVGTVEETQTIRYVI